MSKYTRDLSASIPEDEPFFVIRAKDALAPTIIAMYADLVRAAAVGAEAIDQRERFPDGITYLYDMADEVDNFAASVTAWQAGNPGKVRLPD